MCGIVGYIGSKKVVPVIIEGLRKLEYRGYDSAGIAVVGGQGLLRFIEVRTLRIVTAVVLVALSGWAIWEAVR